MKKKVVLSAGGTGGHLFPAQSLAEALSEYEICFVGGGLSENRYFDRTLFPFKDIETATFSFSKPAQVLRGSRKIYLGVVEAKKFLREFNPNVVVGFGSFFTLPLLIAAAWLKIPIILHEQNAIPGKVNRLFSPLAKKTAVTFPLSRNYLRGKGVIEVEFPLRKHPRVTRDEAYAHFGLDPQGGPVVLIFGGSQGASRLNNLFLEALPHLPRMQVLHFTGTEERRQEAEEKYRALGIKAYARAFEPRIDLAMQAADYAMTRAGAATVNELVEYELPALLIPYPFATENHQEKNGEHFVSIVKGGKMYKEGDLTVSRLVEAMSDLHASGDNLRRQIGAYKLERRVPSLLEVIREIVG